MDDLKAVGPKGHYLGQESTLKLNKENWESKLEDRNEYDRWKDLGSMTMGQRANIMVRDIIENGKLNTLPPELDAKILEILNRADAKESESNRIL
jgi:trimethylamine--corrinoid protein Co-methyltransferase